MVFTDEPIAGVVDGSDEVLRTQEGVELDITLIGQTFVRFAPNGALADAGNHLDEFEGIAWSAHVPSSFGAFVSKMLPISSAHADDDSSSGGGGTTTTQQQGNPDQQLSNSAVFTFKVCPRKVGYKGRSIEVSANGQIRTAEATCTS